MSCDINVIGDDTKSGEILNRNFLGERSHYIEVGTEKIVLPGKFERFLDRIKNFQVRDDDVYVLAFPKSGSRWMTEMVWLLLNDLDFESALNIQLCKRAPFMELEPLFDNPQNEYSYFHIAEELESPRCIMTHLHWTLLPEAISKSTKQPKIIVVLRNPEDTCTSYYYQSAVVEGYSGTWDDFCQLFLEGKVPNGPYWNYVLELWNQRHKSNVMITAYNKMKEDLSSSVREVATFLEKNLTDNDVQKLCNHLSFDNLKNSTGFNLSEVVKRKKGECNPFVRLGKVGDHKNVMSSEVIQAFQDQRTKYLTGTDLILD